MNSPMESPIEFPYQEFPGSPSGKVILRPAAEEDIEAITKIQNQGIQDKIAGVETEFHSYQEQLDWYRDHGSQEPIIVIEHDKKGYRDFLKQQRLDDPERYPRKLAKTTE